MEAAGEPAAEALLDVFKAIEPAELRKHESVLAYWLSIRGNRELPPLRDLDPLEISDAASNSVLLELVGGGEDAEIRHVGEKLKGGSEIDRITDAPRPSILSSIARKLSIVAISRNFLAFEDEFAAHGQTTRCWVTLLPLSAAGAWVDYVYAYVTFETETGEGKKPKKEAVVEEPVAEVAEPVAVVEEPVAEVEEPVAEVEEPVAVVEEVAESPQEEDVLELDSLAEVEPELPVDAVEQEIAEEPIEALQDEPAATAEPEAASAKKKTGFSFDAIAAATGFYGRQSVKVEPVMPTTAKATPKSAPPVSEQTPPVEEAFAPPVEEEAAGPLQEEAAQPVEEEAAASLEEEAALPVEEEPAAVAVEEAAAVPEESPVVAAEEKPRKTSSASEGTLQSKLTEVRTRADEARLAKLRANAALYEGLSAAYDFALDAEDSPEEYLKIVEGAGLKIQLRAPMRPVVKLAFDGMCDDSTIAQLEAVLAWAIDQDLPRGTLAQRIEEEGGIGPILNGTAKAA